MDGNNPFSTDLRYSRLTTPQGFDPFVTVPFKTLIERTKQFATDRTFEVDSMNDASLQMLGIRYFITTAGGKQFAALSGNPHFIEMQPDDSYYRVFEYLQAKPPFGWTPSDIESTIEAKQWTPEVRELQVRSRSGGSIYLSEKFLPGWKATIDGTPAALSSWETAFQAVKVPAGEHRVRFRYSSMSLCWGALGSLISIVLLIAAVRYRAPTP